MPGTFLPGPYHPQSGELCVTPISFTVSEGPQPCYPSMDDSDPFTHHVSEIITQAINQCQSAVKHGFDVFGTRIDSLQRDLLEVKGELLATKAELGNTRKELINIGRGMNSITLTLKPTPSTQAGAPIPVENIQTKLNELKHRLDEVAMGVKNSLAPRATRETGIETEHVPGSTNSLKADFQLLHAPVIRSETLSEASALHEDLSQPLPPSQQRPLPPKAKKRKISTEALIADALEADLQTSSATHVDSSPSRSPSQSVTDKVSVRKDDTPLVSRSASQTIVQDELLSPSKPPSRSSSHPPIPTPLEPSPEQEPIDMDLPTPPKTSPSTHSNHPSPQPEAPKSVEGSRSQSIASMNPLEEDPEATMDSSLTSLESSDQEDQLKDDPVNAKPETKLTIHIDKGKLLFKDPADKKRKLSTTPSGSKSRKRSRFTMRKSRGGKKQKIAVIWPPFDPSEVQADGDKLVKCDGCSRNYHPLCVGLVEGDVRLKEDEIFICPLCVSGQAGEGFAGGREILYPQCSRPQCPAEIYYVEKVIGRRPHDGGFLYLVKWIGYDIDDCTWEPPSNFEPEPERLEAFAELAAQEGVDLDATQNDVLLLEEAKDGPGAWRNWDGSDQRES